ncbi:MAG: DUF501 domain-containing protein [Candidatus Bipolaricaulis sp.]|uniref:DUF501 domain-containing protein n=1 Tax=Candidatus Bipolaricaulis anaerobius TaxID=2026885 RepID=A0A2X3MK37_9BACT|nr:DUF501 domain-containing protein [Candidatus Bipolaricaulis anaerobius]MBP7726282.1 DUF501 domain-containing protein [Candidatus Bipolaricaulis sp.]SQD92284.1 conserved protein of unknown function [Candidatus Bipolaricaulis anaerobius]
MLDPTDLDTIRWQLGRPPAGALAVACRCPYGHPQVVLTHPLHRRGAEFTVFPTLFWLSCPFLVTAVGRLESGGAVKRFEARLATDPDLAARYAAAHDAYRRERLSLLSREEREFLSRVGAGGRLETGIAGLGSPHRVKCLHAHLAHFLARGGNPIGEAVAAELPALACPPQRVECVAGAHGAGPSGCHP